MEVKRSCQALHGKHWPLVNGLLTHTAGAQTAVLLEQQAQRVQSNYNTLCPGVYTDSSVKLIALTTSPIRRNNADTNALDR